MISFKLYYEANIANADAVKAEIVSLLNSASRTKPNLAPGSAIYKWFTNNLMKWLTGPGDPHPWRLGRTAFGGPEHQEGAEVAGPEDIIGLEPHEYKEGEPEWMKKPGVMDFTDTGNWPKLDHIIDYFNSLSDREREKIVKKPYDQVEKEVAAWDEKLANAEISETNLKEDTDYEVIGKDGDYTWVKLSTKEAYECEGQSMGHCVGGYDPDNPGNTIISLWDKKGEPHVTIEIQEYDSEPYDVEGNPRPVRTDVGGAENLKEIVQIKGKQNDAPVGKYKDITARFVKKWLDEGEVNEQAKDISELEESRIVRDDGEGLGMFRHEGSDGAWHWYFEDSKIWDKIYKMDILPMQQYRVQDLLKKIEDDPSVGEILYGDENLGYGFFKEIPKELANIRGLIGDLIVDNNELTSLKNSPVDIDGSVFAANNQLETLEGSPSTVDGDFKVDRNNLKNLKGLPGHISGDLHINMNPALESLKGAENTVVGGTVFVGGWPVEDALDAAEARASALEHLAPDFLKRGNIIDAFKHIGKGLGRGELHPGRWGDTPGEVQYVPPYVRVYPSPPHWDMRHPSAGMG